jgi:hypothetical protein
MLSPYSCERPLAYHLAHKVSYPSEKQAYQAMSQAGGSLEVSGSANTSMDVVYDF